MFMVVRRAVRDKHSLAHDCIGGWTNMCDDRSDIFVSDTPSVSKLSRWKLLIWENSSPSNNFSKLVIVGILSLVLNLNVTFEEYSKDSSLLPLINVLRLKLGKESDVRLRTFSPVYYRLIKIVFVRLPLSLIQSTYSLFLSYTSLLFSSICFSC